MIIRFFKRLFGITRNQESIERPNRAYRSPKDRSFDRAFNVRDTKPELTKEQLTAVDVLARTLWGEARSEGRQGLIAVACVVLNRVAIAQRKGRYWWGTSITTVCLKPYQFSCWNKNDPSYAKLKAATPKTRWFPECLEIAEMAVRGELADITLGSDHYHADYVDPYWAKGEEVVITIGRHLFYRLVNTK